MLFYIDYQTWSFLDQVASFRFCSLNTPSSDEFPFIRETFFFFPTQNALLLDRVVIWLLEVLKHKEDLNTTVFYIKGVADVSEVMETSDLKDS